MKLGLAEKKQFGGSCVNFGCTPSKAVIASAKVAQLARRGHEFGIDIGHVRPDFAKVMDQARTMVAGSVTSVSKTFRGMVDLEVFHAEARFAGVSERGTELEVGGRRIFAKKVVIDTGTQSDIPGIEGLDQIEYLTSESWVDNSVLPKRLVILGGGYIAVEMSQFFARMGSEVTIVEKGPGLLAREDEEVSRAIEDLLWAEGVKLVLNSEVSSVCPQDGAWKLVVGGADFVTDSVFVATGRVPNTRGLALSTVGIETDKHGAIPVDLHSETVVKGIYAVGDVRGGPMFTQTAWDDGRIVLGAITGDSQRTTDRVLPYAVFTDPELARVGLSEREAKEKGKSYKVLRFEMAHNAHAEETRELRGFIKLIVEEGTDLILGAAVLGAEAAETSQIYAVMMAAKVPTSTLRDMLIIHPTYAEAIQNVLL
jgi:pyruvate/2-oxoglutarate dehydrogenase complex dihydrolipoamide dehydrogenase (E3) component